MVLGRGFESQLHIQKLDGNDGSLDGRKNNENNIDRGTLKKYLREL
jgi:hypothetical protein